MFRSITRREGNARWGLVALLLGLPLPIILIVFLFVGGCRAALGAGTRSE